MVSHLFRSPEALGKVKETVHFLWRKPSIFRVIGFSQFLVRKILKKLKFREMSGHLLVPWLLVTAPAFPGLLQSPWNLVALQSHAP